MDEKDKKFAEEFKHLFGVFRRPKQYFSVHPSLVILKRYAEGKLTDRWVRPTTVEPSSLSWVKEETQPAWTLVEVSLHVVRCVQCSKTLAGWRKFEKKAWFDEHILAFGWAGQQVRLWTYACATMFLVLLTFNITTFQVLTVSSARSSNATSTLQIVRDAKLELDHQIVNGYSLFSYFQQQETKVKSRLEHLKML